MVTAACQGQQIGLSGDTGCSTTPQLHFMAFRAGNGGGFVQVDPYGWDSPALDPWALHPEGAASAWLWRPGQAPEMFIEAPWPANAGGGTAPVATTNLRIMGWQDAPRPNNEFVG